MVGKGKNFDIEVGLSPIFTKKIKAASKHLAALAEELEHIEEWNCEECGKDLVVSKDIEPSNKKYEVRVCTNCRQEYIYPKTRTEEQEVK